MLDPRIGDSLSQSNDAVHRARAITSQQRMGVCIDENIDAGSSFKQVSDAGDLDAAPKEAQSDVSAMGT